jgi:hypothetical protein
MLGAYRFVDIICRNYLKLVGARIYIFYNQEALRELNNLIAFTSIQSKLSSFKGVSFIVGLSYQLHVLKAKKEIGKIIIYLATILNKDPFY